MTSLHPPQSPSQEPSLSFGPLFRGMMDREEMASAFLAMALEGVPSFRELFFSLLGPEALLQELMNEEWTVAVEHERIDVTMSSRTWRVLIENKIRPGAKQAGQLLRYFRQAGPAPERLLVVYLAPGEMGRGEIAEVEASPEFDETKHAAVQVSWEDLFEFEPGDHPFEVLVADGLANVKRIVDGTGTVYAAEGVRALIRFIFGSAHEITKARAPIAYHRWSGRDYECLRSVRTNLSHTVLAVFEADPDPPYTVRSAVAPDGSLELRLSSTLKIAGKARRNRDLLEWWDEEMRRGSLEAPGIPTHLATDDGAFHYAEAFRGTEDEIATRLAEVTCATAEALETMLEGQDLRILR